MSKVFKKIQESNKEFEKATKAEKRVMIAKDCLDYISKNHLKAKTGNTFARGLLAISSSNSIQATFGEETCTVCAKGALFFGAIMRNGDCTYNNVISSQYDGKNDDYEPLLKFFSHKQLALIETAFEGQCYEHRNEKGREVGRMDIITCDEFNSAEHFYHAYITDTLRFRGILENIIENKGWFKPELY